MNTKHQDRSIGRFSVVTLVAALLWFQSSCGVTFGEAHIIVHVNNSPPGTNGVHIAASTRSMVGLPFEGRSVSAWDNLSSAGEIIINDGILIISPDCQLNDLQVEVTTLDANGCANGYGLAVLQVTECKPYSIDVSIRVDAEIPGTVQLSTRTEAINTKITPSARITARRLTMGNKPSAALIDCGARCTCRMPFGTQVSLSATRDQDDRTSVFRSWRGGGCSGTGQCLLTLIEDTEIVAELSQFVCNELAPGWCWLEPSPRLSIGTELRAVHGTSAADVWLVGNKNITMHWDGFGMNEQYASDIASLRAVWAFEPKNAWAVGFGTTREHWDGRSWVRTGDGLSGTPLNLNGIWGFAGRVWAVGIMGTAFLWDGGDWSPHSHPDQAITFFGVSGYSSADVWMVGSRTLSGSPNRTGLLARYQGEWKTPIETNVDEKLTGAALQNNVLWMSSSSSLTDCAKGTGRVYILKNEILTSIAPESGEPMPGLLGIWTDPNGVDDRGWIVGCDRMVLRRKQTTLVPELPKKDGVRLTGVWGSRFDDLWVVGYMNVENPAGISGLVLRYSPHMAGLE